MKSDIQGQYDDQEMDAGKSSISRLDLVTTLPLGYSLFS